MLREADYRQVQAAIHELPGVRFGTQTRLLAPDAGFARQVLPGYGPDGRSARRVPGLVGPHRRCRRGDRRNLAGAAAAPGTPVTVTLDRDVQSAAEDAVDPVGQQAMLVAVRPSTGELLAVAQNAAADAEGPVALLGRYPPGSTAKIVTTDAALARGLTPSSPVGCPAGDDRRPRGAQQRTARPRHGAAEHRIRPLVQHHVRPARRRRRGPGLSAAARRLGLGADYEMPGATTVTGSVPPADDVVRRAANGFGQGDVVASPLGWPWSPRPSPVVRR